VKTRTLIGGPFDGQALPPAAGTAESFLILPVPSCAEPVEYAGYSLSEEQDRRLVYRFVGTMSRAELDWHGFFEDHPQLA